ncbi:MAG: hypothetical protein NC253_03935 [Ruminococcus sp.]|nr:hypothetical protein [Ruminococcus sp.]MCM1381734.1 hypothetical protein [Muribaculaceae bacterium]MCM1479857.1 hypothetical protein [Muribaculaceae bacterium]
MESFRAIAFAACFLGIVITIFNSLYPSEKFAKQIKTIFSLIFILSVAKPIAAGKIEFPEIGDTVSASAEYYSSLNDNTYSYFISSVESNISAALAGKLREKNIYPEEIETSINISENGSISINEVKITLKDMADKAETERCVIDETEQGVTVTVKEYNNAGNNW